MFQQRTEQDYKAAKIALWGSLDMYSCPRSAVAHLLK